MAIKQLEPGEAKTAMDEAENSVYLDVRTEMEFAQGIPKALSISPLQFPARRAWCQIPIF